MVGWWTHSPTGLRFDILEAAQQAAQQDSSRSSSTSTKRPWLISRLSKDFVPLGLFVFLLGKGQSPTKTSGISCERALLSLVASCDTSLRLCFSWDLGTSDLLPRAVPSFVLFIFVRWAANLSQEIQRKAFFFCSWLAKIAERQQVSYSSTAYFEPFEPISARHNGSHSQIFSCPPQKSQSWLNDVFRRPKKMMSFAKCWSAGSQGFAWREHVKSPSNGLPWTERDLGEASVMADV